MWNITKKQWRGIVIRALVMLGIALLVLKFIPNRTSPLPRKENYSVLMFQTMSTSASARLYHPDPKYDFEPAFETVRSEFRKVCEIADLFDPESELSRLNREAADKPFRCSEELWELLTKTRFYWEKTDGAFDITVAPLLDLWGFHRKNGTTLPSPGKIREVLEKTGMDKIEFSETAHTVRFKVPGMKLDLGGIAKGWALDRAMKALVEKHGIRKGFLNLGGNVLAFGGDFTAGVRDPFDGRKICAKVRVSGVRAMATSGSYERFVVIDGKEYGHIIDPVSGRPSHDLFSATVIAGTGLESDALSTSFYLRGAAMAEKFPGTAYLLIGRKTSAPDETEAIFAGADWEIDLPLYVPGASVSGGVNQPDHIKDIGSEKE